MDSSSSQWSKLDDIVGDVNDAPIKQRDGVFDPSFGDKFSADEGLADRIDNYYRELDERNASCRWYAKICSLCFCVTLLLFTVLYLIIARRGYQKLDPIVGNVQVRVRGVALQTPDPSIKQAAVFDAADLKVPAKERNAVFLATNIFTAQPQLRFDPGQTAHKKCADVKPCTCGANVQCADCAQGEYSSSGVMTGLCVDIAPQGGASQPDRRCEVRAWCPVAEVNRIQRAQYQPDEENNGQVKLKDVENMKIDIQINARAESFEKAVQHRTTLKLGTLLKQANIDFEATKESGAIIYSQVTFDCNLDAFGTCEPRISYVRMDETQASGSPNRPGYNVKHVRYSTETVSGSAVQYRHVQQLTGFRIVFDLNGYARQFDFGVLVMTLAVGLAIAAVGFLVIDQVRQNLERVYLKSREERGPATLVTGVDERRALLAGMDDSDDDSDGLADVDLGGGGAKED